MKGIIVAAGYGTRFLPVTKTIAKEMLPLVTVPSIQFIVDEFVNAGIRDIVIISSRRKKALEDYFDREIELESIFEREGKTAALKAIAPSPASIAFVRQQKMMGTGHALLQVRSWVGNEPCVVAYPDDLHFGSVPLAAQLADAYEKTGSTVMASITVPGDVSRYGVFDLAEDGVHVRSIVEKPVPGTEPGHEVSIGRYLVTPEFFDLLDEGWKLHCAEAEKNGREPGEYFHIYALNRLMEAGKVIHAHVEGVRLDTGEPAGYLEAILRYADTQSSLKPVIDSFIANRS
ncbi:MAG TPA: UTP--glucose-1-phosphate uridylyltransferase [Treponemataceae bacterium]|jgi:UTP--glucose-1-phosphate uridylyltransferase|nr:MAG: UTP--glucose-1-phosphate uridylyltransferase [Spirochaetes bacterium ADurb.Bin215]HOF85677.1 UTP--glucose-1-phosphate uridylyltransferase [Treponemataceae bacterium]HOS35962.1 UTP--glucose-1-phosphate uridylyltransferase [Treponemataceae bacterium]HPA10630.1 UTP--glucose-1-phosphate uridylyltransferase [Treponemataceae bacterium]HPL92058.1 UTP--glucose-1-phosphate uridylyltransferase [Treponemataceae bacterium]